MATTYTLIEKITVNAATATAVTFSNIPQTYTDLVVRISARGSRATQTNDGLLINLNGVTTNITNRYYEGVGSGTPSTGTNGWGVAYSIGIINGPTSTAATFGNAEVYIPSYASAVFKPILVDSVMEDNATTAFYDTYSLLWSSTSAINSVGFTVYNGGSFQQYSEFSLYGVTGTGAISAAQPKALGGDSIAFDGTYWYHAFTSSGTFTPKATLTASILQIAGGGGGGGTRGGGGGAGGVSYISSQLLISNSTLTALIGAGGIGGIGGTPNGLAVQGNNSVLTGPGISLTAANGGGYGGTIRINNGSTVGAYGGSGGSGGGGALSLQSGSYTSAGGSATPSGQGNAGGTGYTGSEHYAGGGGGGAGAVGSAGTSTTGGNGGVGVNTYSSWASATSTGVSGYYAGGGGGSTYNDTNTSTGGSGGGGAGATSTTLNGIAGTANTGGGGGGAYNNDLGVNYTGGTGGSGIVIVRYAG